MESISFQQLDEFYHAVVDAFPYPLIIVEKDVVIVDYNTCAAKMLACKDKQIVDRRLGDALQCLHSFDNVGGCGRGPDCVHCVVRNSVNQSLNGDPVYRRKARIEVLVDGTKNEAFFLVTTSPLNYADRTYAVITLDELPDAEKAS